MKRYYITHCISPRDIDDLIKNDNAFKDAKRDGRFILLDDNHAYNCIKKLERREVGLLYTRRFEVHEIVDGMLIPCNYTTENREYAAIEASKRRQRHPELLISAYDTHLKQYYI